MTNKENIDILTRAFSALPKKDLRRLKYHLDNNTPIFCGGRSDIDYIDADTRFA